MGPGTQVSPLTSRVPEGPGRLSCKVFPAAGLAGQSGSRIMSCAHRSWLAVATVVDMVFLWARHQRLSGKEARQEWKWLQEVAFSTQGMCNQR